MVAAGVTAFALTDMILHNRRKRSAFYAEQRALYAERLLDAIETERAGRPLDDDQTLILNRERARVQAEEAKKERSLKNSIKGFIMGGLKEEEGAVAETPKVLSEGEILNRIGIGKEKVLEAADGLRAGELEGAEEPRTGNELRQGESRVETSPILNYVREERREGERAMNGRGVKGGPLDQMAEAAVANAKSKGTNSWWTWRR